MGQPPGVRGLTCTRTRGSVGTFHCGCHQRVGGYSPMTGIPVGPTHSDGFSTPPPFVCYTILPVTCTRIGLSVGVKLPYFIAYALHHMNRSPVQQSDSHILSCRVHHTNLNHQASLFYHICPPLHKSLHCRSSSQSPLHESQRSSFLILSCMPSITRVIRRQSNSLILSHMPSTAQIIVFDGQTSVFYHIYPPPYEIAIKQWKVHYR